MKLILKNLKQVEYEIQIESNSITVKDLKIEIEKLYSYDSTQIKLLFQGSILDNSKILSSYNITDNSTLIMMNTKIKQISNNNININNNIQNKSQTNKDIKNQDITDILKDNLKIQIDSLVDMGFERSQVEIAVKTANGRIDLAIEYLNKGIPDNLNNNINRMNNNVRNNNIRNEIMKELKKQASIIKVLCKDNKYMIFSILDNIKRNDPGLLRLITDYRNEFEKLLDTPITEEDENNYKNIETKADEIINKRLEDKAKKIQEKIEKEQKEKSEKEKEQKEKEKKEEEQKENNKEINTEENKQKEKLEEKMDQEEVIKDNNNEEKKENIINDKEEEKKEIIKIVEEKENSEKNENLEKNAKIDDKIENFKDIDNKNNKQKDENNNQIENQLTEEDKEVINRLKNLGDFPNEKVVEAYIVCNKNEELTANYLFEQYN